jgi:hypothetical protein
MKLPSIFTKAPAHKRFSYTPRYYDPLEEQRKEREDRIRNQISLEKGEEVSEYRTRIAGSFRSSRKSQGSRMSNPSVALLRLLVLLVLSVWLIAFLQFGKDSIYLLLVFVPVYLFLRFRKTGTR